MHRDLLQQAYSAMRHDLRRTLLTMAGMAWGIATVVLLLSYGNGFGKAIETIFESFGATAVGVFPGRTSQQAGGNKAGVQVRFTNDDIELMRNNIPLCRHVVRMAQKDSTVQNNNRSFTFPVMGLDPSIQEIWNLDIAARTFSQRCRQYAARTLCGDRIGSARQTFLRHAGGGRINPH